MTEQERAAASPGHRNRAADEAKPWYRRWWGITAIGVAALVVLSVVSAGPDEEEAVKAELETETEPAVEDEPDPTPVAEPEPTPTPESEPDEPAEPNAVAEPDEPADTDDADRRALLAALAFDPIELSGTGDDVVELALPDDFPRVRRAHPRRAGRLRRVGPR